MLETILGALICLSHERHPAIADCNQAARAIYLPVIVDIQGESNNEARGGLDGDVSRVQG